MGMAWLGRQRIELASATKPPHSTSFPRLRFSPRIFEPSSSLEHRRWTLSSARSDSNRSLCAHATPRSSRQCRRLASNSEGRNGHWRSLPPFLDQWLWLEEGELTQVENLFTMFWSADSRCLSSISSLPATLASFPSFSRPPSPRIDPHRSRVDSHSDSARRRSFEGQDSRFSRNCLGQDEEEAQSDGRKVPPRWLLGATPTSISHRDGSRDRDRGG